MSKARKPKTWTLPDGTPITPALAVEIAEGDNDDGDTMAVWQYLHSTGLAYQLQGWYGRTAQDLIRQGLIHD